MPKLVLTVILILAALLWLTALSAAAQDSLKVYLEVGGKAMKAENYARAIEAYERILELSPHHPEAVANLGVAYSATGNTAKAKEYLHEALEIYPLAADVANNLGVVYSAERNTAKAIEYFEQAAKLSPKNSLYLNNLGQEYARAGQAANALRALRSAYGLAPDNPAVCFSLGTTFASTESLDSAEIYFEKSLRAGASTVDLHYFLGTVKNRLGKTDEAANHLRSVVEMQPNHVGALQLLGLIYLGQQRYAEAIEEFGRVTRADSTYWAGWIGLGAAYSLDGMTPKADTVLRRLFAVDSTLGFQMLKVIGQEHAKRTAGAKSDRP